MADAAVDVCVPLLKFSHATGLHNGSIAWEHITRGGLCLLVRGSSGRGSPLILRVIQATKDLEHVELGSYIDAAIDRHEREQRAGLPPAFELLPIFGITKESLLAIRYDNRGEPRRVQIRFEGPAQCQQMVAILRDRGMVFQEQRAKTARPDTTTSRPGTAYSDARPPTAHVSSPHFQQGNTRETYQHGGLHSNISPQRPSTVTAAEPPKDLSSSVNRTYDVPAPPSFVRTGSLPSTSLDPAGLTIAQAYENTPEQYKAPEPRRFQPLAVGDAFQCTEQPHRVPQHRPAESVLHAYGDSVTSSDSSPGLQPLHLQHASSAAAKTHIPAPWSSDPIDPPPMNALSSTSLSEILDQQIPPRRELPFKRPASSRSDAHSISSRPGSSALSLPPLKKLKPLEKQALSAARPETASMTPSRTESVLGARPATMENSSPKRKPETSVAGSIEQNQLTNLRTPNPSATSKSAPTDEHLYGKHTLPMRKDYTSTPRVGSLTDAPHEVESPTNATGTPINVAAPRKHIEQPVASPERDKSIDRAYVALHHTNTRPVAETSLELYEEQSLEDRRAALDTFMIDHLENPAFTTLCADIENCWRRIALGL